MFSRQSPVGRRREIPLILFVFCLLVTAYCLLILPATTVPTAFAGARTREIKLGPLDGKTDAQGLPWGWKELTFPDNPIRTQYTTVKQGGKWVIRAQSRNSSSGLVRELELDPRQYPIIKWRWKVRNLLPVTDENQKAGDDYAARITIMFKYLPELASVSERALYDAGKTVLGKYPPKATINYVWANKSPKDKIFNNPYSDRGKMIVVESGPTLVGRWVGEERNFYEDYKTCFGAEPPPITGIVLMTDSDNTHAETEAYFGDILLQGKN